MIIPVSIQFNENGKPELCLAIAVRHVDRVEDVREIRDSLLSLLVSCLSSDEVADNFRTEDLYWLTKLIDAMTTSLGIIEEKEGGRS